LHDQLVNEYDTAGRKTKETYPDHVAGSQIGGLDYGIVQFTYDGRCTTARMVCSALLH